MGGCEDIQDGISAMLDGEVDADELAKISKHLESCSKCRACEMELVEVNTRLSLLEGELPGDFDREKIWERVQVDLDDFDQKPSDHRPSDHRPSDYGPSDYGLYKRLAAVAVAACFALALAADRWLISPSPETLQTLVAETIRDYETFQLRGELLDVHATTAASAIAWMSPKVNFELPEIVYPPAGYRMSGGRLCSFLNRRLAFFHYEKKSADVALYVMEAKDLELPDNGLYKTSVRDEGLTTVTWAQGELVYVVVSELPTTDVIDFVSRS